MTERELLRLAQAGDASAADRLVRDYAPFAYWLAKETGFDLPGADRDDLMQEALYGLALAIRDYRPERGCTFRSFVVIVVRRWLCWSLRRDSAQKHQQLTRAVRGDVSMNDEGDQVDVLELVPARDADPADVAVTRQELHRLLAAFDTLSAKEATAVVGLAVGLSYAELGDRGAKWIDNAAQRGRTKLRRAA